MSDERPETCARCGAPLVWCKCDGETSPTPTTREAAKEHAWNYSADEDDTNSFYHGFDAGWSAALTVPAGKTASTVAAIYTLTHPHHGTILNVKIAEGAREETGVELPLSISGFAHWQDADYLRAMGWTITAADEADE